MTRQLLQHGQEFTVGQKVIYRPTQKTVKILQVSAFDGPKGRVFSYRFSDKDLFPTFYGASQFEVLPIPKAKKGLKDYIIFNLAAHAPEGLPDHFPELTLYEQIKRGVKTSEYRQVTERWQSMLFGDALRVDREPLREIACELTKFLRVKKAWFVTGYPKGSLPRLEADIVGIKYWPNEQFFEIMVNNIKEVT